MLEDVAALGDIAEREEYLIAELDHALHGDRSEKLTEDEQQLAFEDLSIALAEVEAEKDKRAVKAGSGATRPALKRTIGNLPATLPRIEEVVEPAILICPYLTLKYECVYLHAWDTGMQASAGVHNWMKFYNHSRPHKALAG